MQCLPPGGKRSATGSELRRARRPGGLPDPGVPTSGKKCPALAAAGAACRGVSPTEYCVACPRRNKCSPSEACAGAPNARKNDLLGT